MQKALNNAKTIAAIVSDETAKIVKAKPNKKAAKTAIVPALETVAATASEALPDPRIARAERLAADRTTIGAFFSAYNAQARSIPVKAINSSFKLAPTTAHPITRNPSPRQAAAICAAFSAAGKKLQSGISVPRVFEINGVNSSIENGVLRDAVSSGLAIVRGDTAETETISITDKALAQIRSIIGDKILNAASL